MLDGNCEHTCDVEDSVPTEILACKYKDRQSNDIYIYDTHINRRGLTLSVLALGGRTFLFVSRGRVISTVAFAALKALQGRFLEIKWWPTCQNGHPGLLLLPKNGLWFKVQAVSLCKTEKQVSQASKVWSLAKLHGVDA